MERGEEEKDVEEEGEGEGEGMVSKRSKRRKGEDLKRG